MQTLDAGAQQSMPQVIKDQLCVLLTGTKDTRPNQVVFDELGEGVKSVAHEVMTSAMILATSNSIDDRSRAMQVHRDLLDRVSLKLNRGVSRFSAQLHEARKTCNQGTWRIDYHIQSPIPHLPLIYEKSAVETLAILITTYWRGIAESVGDCDSEHDRGTWRCWVMDLLNNICKVQVDRCIAAAVEEIEELEKSLKVRKSVETTPIVKAETESGAELDPPDTIPVTPTSDAQCNASLQQPTSASDSLVQLANLAESLGHDGVKLSLNISQVMSCPSLSVDNKLRKVFELSPEVIIKRAEWWADNLGVTRQAVEKTRWWKEDRRGILDRIKEESKERLQRNSE